MNSYNPTNDPSLSSLYFMRDVLKKEEKIREEEIAKGIRPLDLHEKKRREEKLIKNLRVRNRQIMAYNFITIKALYIGYSF